MPRPHVTPRISRRSFLATTAGACTFGSDLIRAGSDTSRVASALRTTSVSPGFSEEQKLFEEQTHGYSCFRIPAVVRTNAGTLLAFAEGRVNNCGDAGDIDLVMRRSTDGGQTWGPLQVLIDGNGDTRGNPAPVVDRASGRISLLSTYNPGDNENIRLPYLQHSEDDGVTWTDPVQITDQVSKPEWEWWYGTGPVHGIQLEHGAHAGRLVVPSYYSTGPGQPGGVVLTYSDDGGLTWQRGAIAEHPDTTLRPGENTIAELPDGRIIDLAREGGSTPEPGNRAVAFSSDGGETFDAPFTTEHELAMPMVQGALLSLDGRLLFSAPAHPAAREVMSIRASDDHGDTWQTWEEGKVIWWGPAGYSDLVRIDDRLTGLLYEAGEGWAYESIRWIRFDDEYLRSPNGEPPGIPEPPEPGPTTEDASRFGHTAYVRGGAVVGDDGRHGRALELDGTDDRIEIPFADTLDLDNHDFTWSIWFRYTAPSGNHALIWAYRMGSNTTPQVWLRAEPGNNRLRALLGSDLDWGASVTAAGARNDGSWHHVALRRDGGRLSLCVDGAEAAARDVSEHGSVTIGREFGAHGIHVGQRVDGANRFRGSIDDVRIYTRALSDDEIARLAAGDAVGRHGLALHLPLDRVRS
ncbi:sialidase family protein [Phytoactinopolyspora halotolerans]|uniref:exo-alpha-sialidase n=1 Tax=Phytoactinopolyspora halotolerans TaxID=1981512 RepID=A0A6L9SEQ2_9ACTN|nr:sialidase family protein [Phytoactinopolyspora halotolerans]NEE03134.1 neuraminidase [Phytoactinopolyspora halotolerans]